MTVESEPKAEPIGPWRALSEEGQDHGPASRPLTRQGWTGRKGRKRCRRQGG